GAPTNAAGLRPWNIVDGSLDDLSTPDGVAIDRSYFEQLGIAQIRQRAEINNQKARVAAVTSGIRSFTTTPHVFASLERARAYLGVPPNRANYYVVRIAPNANAAVVRSLLGGTLSDAEVLTPDQFRHRTRLFWLFDTGAGAALLGSAIGHHRRHYHRRADALFEHQGSLEGVRDAARYRLGAPLHSQGHSRAGAD